MGMPVSAAFADAELAFPHPLQGVLDAVQFTALDLGQLRADLVLDRIERRIDHIAGGLRTEFLQQAQVAGQMPFVRRRVA